MLEFFESIYYGIKSLIILFIGVYCYNKYEEKHKKPPLQFGPFLLQVIVLFGSGVADYFGYEGYSSHKALYIFWIISFLITYGIGLWMCWKHEKEQHHDQSDSILAMAAQAIIPLGLAGMLLLAFKLIMVLFSPILDIFSFKGIVVIVLIVFLGKNFS